MANQTDMTVDQRKADQWPRHRAKARRRNLTRRTIARMAQRDIDDRANRRPY